MIVARLVSTRSMLGLIQAQKIAVCMGMDRSARSLTSFFRRRSFRKNSCMMIASWLSRAVVASGPFHTGACVGVRAAYVRACEVRDRRSRAFDLTAEAATRGGVAPLPWSIAIDCHFSCHNELSHCRYVDFIGCAICRGSDKRCNGTSYPPGPASSRPRRWPQKIFPGISRFSQ